MKIGMGFDIHRLVPDRPLMLGGVKIPFPKGLLGHSDADVLLHALCDALLGAAGAGDMGAHFPDTDPKWKDTPSVRFVEKAVELLGRSKMRVVNADLILVTEEPKLAPHKRAIQESVAQALGIDHRKVNVKAKRMEGLGEIGAGEAMAAYAVVLVE
ncbi:MAG: 2-C-methyl-D-erythritol 2,4-cyclodiphosphate synthase [Candidatus Omnitrophica bacterium]|nr:2-C-methyl-D-erythritol 2,4-cyclodiphosphate synthase [Candidatus Omnitrophota bacterium]